MADAITGPDAMAYYQGQVALSLFASAGSSSDSSGTDTTSALLGYYEAKEGIVDPSTDPAVNIAPAAPWQSGDGVPTVSDAVQKAIAGQALIDPGASQLSAPAGTSTQDYKNLFALYQGLNTLSDIAQTAQSAASNPSGPPLDQLQAAFASGMDQLQTFLSGDPFSGFNITAGTVTSSQQSSVGIPNGGAQTYATGVLATGDRDAQIQTLTGDVRFTISVKDQYAPAATIVAIDLSGLGSRPRTIDNVVNYINGQLKAAGVQSRFAVASLGAAPAPPTIGGQASATAGSPQWGLTVSGPASEAISFSAPSSTAAVYVSEATGGVLAPGADPGQPASPTGERLVKLQTAADATATPPPAAVALAANVNLPAGGVFSNALPTGVTRIRASATGGDGSIYLLADAAGAVGGSPVPGGQGAALLKYDSAGKLLYSKILAGEPNAVGYALAVDTDGSVAVAGSTTTAAAVTAYGLPTPAATSAFVQVFDPSGAPRWSQAAPASGGDSTASGVAFDAQGGVYLSGTTTGSVGNRAQHGSADEFIQGFSAAGAATFTTQFGSTGENRSAGLAYDSAAGALYTAGIENGQAVVRGYTLNGNLAPTLFASRSLGSAESLAGIAVSAGRVVVGGTVSAATIKAGTVAQAYAGLSDGFIAAVSTGLAPSAADTVAYLGAPGQTRTATGLAVAGGQAFLTGTIVGDPSGPAGGEGFVTGIDTATGVPSYATRFSGEDGRAAPSAVAVSTAGASVLDRLGLPQGPIDAARSDLIVANTAIKAGDSFYVRTAPAGVQTTITITATDTVTTLAAKLTSALGAQGTATVLPMSSGSQIEISPASPSSFIELDSTPAGPVDPLAAAKVQNTQVLAALGLNTGVVRTVRTVNGLTDVTQLREYGLELPSDLRVDTTANAQNADNWLQSALSAVRRAYQDLADPPTMATEAAAQAQSSGGSVPTYLTDEIANYQAGLNRLLGGG